MATLLTNLHAVPYWSRALLVCALLATVAAAERVLRGARATRWKEYAAWLVMSTLCAAFGACHDLVTSAIAPSYFVLGKGLARRDPSEFAMAVADLGARAGCSAGLLLGGVVLMANTARPGRPSLSYARLARLALVPSLAALLMAPLTASAWWWDPQGLGPELRSVLSEGEVGAFLRVQRAHLGTYLGAVLATGWLVVRMRRAVGGRPTVSENFLRARASGSPAMKGPGMNTLEKWGGSLMRAAFYGLMCVGTWFMLEACASYLELGEAHPFFLEKLPLQNPLLWRTALYVHVPSALFALPACLVLLVRGVRGRWPRVHRWLGRVTGLLVLCAVVPSGMYLALFAQGGLVTTTGFWLTGLITFVAMVKSIRSARARDMKAHRRFSGHVVAQLGVAVISRFMLVGAESLGVYHEWVYIAALWIPVLGCMLVAELVAGRRPFSTSKGLRHEEARPVRHPHAVH